MKRSSLYLLAMIWLLTMTVQGLWAHKGVDHGEGPEYHPLIRTLHLGPDSSTKVTFAQLPDRPFAGQQTQFMFRLEEQLAIDDPLLGGAMPLVPAFLQVELVNPNGRVIAAVENFQSEEAGTFGFRHTFSRAGEWTLNLKFGSQEDSSQAASLDLVVKERPPEWSLWMLQGVLLLGGVGLAIQRFHAGSARLLSSLLIGVVVVAGWLLLAALWPSSVAAISGTLGPTALVEAEADETPTLFEDGDLPRLLSPSSNLMVGTVRYPPDRVAQVRSPFAGTIVYSAQSPTVGDQVRAGQLLATIENHFIEHDYVHLFPLRWELVKGQLVEHELKTQAEAAYERAAHLLELGAISRREFEQSEFELKKATESAKGADERLALHDTQIKRSNIKVTEIRAPVSGQVTAASYSSGQMVYEGDPVYEITDLSVVWLEANVFPADVGRVRQSPQAQFFSTVQPNKRVMGQLLTILPEVDLESKTIKAVYRINNPDGWLREGMSLNLELSQQAAAAGQLVSK